MLPKEMQQQFEMMRQAGFITKTPFAPTEELIEILGLMLNISYITFLIVFIPIFIFHMWRKERELLITKRKNSNGHEELLSIERKATEDLWRGDIRYMIYSDKQIIQSAIKLAIISSFKIAAGIFALNTILIIILAIITAPFFLIFH